MAIGTATVSGNLNKNTLAAMSAVIAIASSGPRSVRGTRNSIMSSRPSGGQMVTPSAGASIRCSLVQASRKYIRAKPVNGQTLLSAVALPEVIRSEAMVVAIGIRGRSLWRDDTASVGRRHPVADEQ